MDGFLFKSKLLDLLCNQSKSENELPLQVPLSSDYYPAVTLTCAIALITAATLAFSLGFRRCRQAGSRLSNAAVILLLAALSSLFLSVYFLLGGGVHGIRDRISKQAQLLFGGVGVAFLFAALSKWVETQHRLLVHQIGLRKGEVSKRSTSWITVLHLAPVICGYTYCFYLTLNANTACIPLISLERRVSPFLASSMIISTALHSRQLTKTTEMLKW